MQRRRNMCVAFYSRKSIENLIADGMSFMKWAVISFYDVGDDENRVDYSGVCDRVLYDRLSIQVQHSYEKNFLSTSKGVRKFKRFLGRLFISSTMFCKSSSEMLAKEVPFGKNCRSRPLVFSFVPRCHGE